MASLKSRLQLYIQAQKALAVAALLATVGFYVWGYRPNASRLHEMAIELGGRQEHFQQTQSQAAELDHLKQNIAAIEARLGSGKQLSAPAGFNAFIDIPRIVRRDAGGQLDVAWGQVEKAELYTEQPVSLTFAADFGAVFSAIRQIEDLPQLTRVRGLSIRSIDARKGTVTVTLSLSVYSAQS
jgi:Tfp pilus assembly protein PilO